MAVNSARKLSSRIRPRVVTFPRRPERGARAGPVSARAGRVSRVGFRTTSQGGTMQLRTLDDVFADQVADLLSAEQQLVVALPKVASAASSDKLRNAIGEHLEESRGHVRRLEKVMRSVDLGFPQARCEGMAGLIKEGEEIV